ncbi:MAG: hypothetical protein IPK58_12310 [Acidobacteria bacterium]|nr:hypothetical protein [Acidobacteriota bacterium]
MQEFQRIPGIPESRRPEINSEIQVPIADSRFRDSKNRSKIPSKFEIPRIITKTALVQFLKFDNVQL